MTWITGTATGLKDLLDKVQGHLTDEGWTVNSYTTGGGAPNTDVLYVTGPGYGAGYEVSFQIRTFENSPQNHYCLELKGSTAYDAGQNWENQPGRSPQSCVMRLWDSSMPYWLSISDRRMLLIAKCSNSYHSMYAGFFNPFANPIEYPYPMYIAADAPDMGPFGATEVNTRSVAFPGRGAGFFRDAGGSWRYVNVYDDDASFDWNVQGIGKFTIWPYLAMTNSTDNPGAGTANTWQYLPLARVADLPSIPESLFMMNCYIMGMTDEAGVMGVLEGVYWIPGNTLSAEQQLTVDGDDYRVFIAISRSTESPSQFYAVKEV